MKTESTLMRRNQPLCNVLHDRFAYPEIESPAMTPEEACNDWVFSRRGIAHWMLYGVVEELPELIASIIQSGRPFTEIVTSEDIISEVEITFTLRWCTSALPIRPRTSL